MYFKALFEEENLNNVVFKLNGQSEMFYRKASISDSEKIVHKANEPIDNKNPLNSKKQSRFSYDIVKDKRFTKSQFSLHSPITLNFKAEGSERINLAVRAALKECKDNYVIGIDRGERHLLYVCVVNSKGEIVEQYSLNEIVNQHKGENYTTSYHDLLDKKEDERKKAKQDWKSVGNIKELKDGYVSQAVHKICELVEKYDAIIAMEDLNSGFKNSRVKVEKQVYQKFEKMLIDKLNFYVNKKKSSNEVGGLYNAYQLTEKFVSFQKMGLQNGFIFYIPAWLTSKIDPTTGFVNLLHPKYQSTQSSKQFFEKFENISFNSKENYFEFWFDYSNFDRGVTDYQRKWTVCTNGERIETFRNSEKNSQWDNRTINLTEKLIALFEKFEINYLGNNLKTQIINQTEKSFFKELSHILNLTLQMRNSVTGKETDYLISPVKNSKGEFYNSELFDNSSKLPSNADANGAYHIAKKALWAIQKIQDAKEDELAKVKLSISNKEWLEFVQKGN